jgi:outer membrane protein TolC
VVSAPHKPVALPHALPSFGAMSKAALQKRPEIREAGYNVRINQREAEVALLELLPGIGPLLTANTDTNSYLYNPNWVTAGAKASWNLMKIFAYPRRRAAVEAEAAYLDEKALATAVVIMTEVQVARVNYLQSQERFRIAQELYDVETSILKQMSSSQEAGSIGEHILLRQDLRALLAEAKKDLAYAEYQNAFGMLFVSMGMDFTQDAIDGDLSLAALSTTLEMDWRLKCKQALKQ